MSPPLPKSFEHLRIATPQDTGNSRKRRPCEVIRPQRQRQINLYTGLPHLQYYGYAVSRDWLVAFTEQHWPEALPERDARNYRKTAIRRAYELIGHLTGIPDLARKTCFNPKGDSVPPEWFASLYDEADDPEDMETVIVFALCSDEDDDFEGRPTQDKVDFMTNLVGHAPQWWVSCGYAD
ncbi:hypothetical protein M405DRAFT_820231 [Rhizopogon salebrosus TDB-379]|nr:hypothetical protein M405DRAFT_820231 [Rhizopogon salebrosus TDB-379]